MFEHDFVYKSSQFLLIFNVLTFFTTWKPFSSFNFNIKNCICKKNSNFSTVFYKHYFSSLIKVKSGRCKKFILCQGCFSNRFSVFWENIGPNPEMWIIFKVWRAKEQFLNNFRHHLYYISLQMWDYPCMCFFLKVCLTSWFHWIWKLHNQTFLQLFSSVSESKYTVITPFIYLFCITYFIYSKLSFWSSHLLKAGDQKLIGFH